jgi:thiamine-phosphate pyrophosphorylase
MTRFALPPLNAIIDADAAERAGWDVVDLARAFVSGGAAFLQLRVKTWGSGRLLEAASAIALLARDAGATFVVNDRADIARLAGAAGVHLGQDDLPPADVRRIVGETAVVGLSTHTPAQIDAAVRQPVTYVAVGPVFGTATKQTGYEAIGLHAVRDAARQAADAGLPLVAIGGITLDRAPDVIGAGAASVAVIGDLLATADPEARVREYVRALA